MSLRTRPAVPVAALGLAVALTGCGANFQAQTYAERNNADGTNAAVGAIAIRNATLLAPERGDTYEAGDDAEVALTLANDGPEDDRLVEATSPAAASVQVLEEGEEVDAVELPRLGTTGGQVALQLTGLAQDLRPGRYVDVTLRFERNGEVTIAVPVATTGEYDEDRERSENFHEIGEEH